MCLGDRKMEKSWDLSSPHHGPIVKNPIHLLPLSRRQSILTTRDRPASPRIGDRENDGIDSPIHRVGVTGGRPEDDELEDQFPDVPDITDEKKRLFDKIQKLEREKAKRERQIGEYKIKSPVEGMGKVLSDHHKPGRTRPIKDLPKEDKRPKFQPKKPEFMTEELAEDGRRIHERNNVPRRERIEVIEIELEELRDRLADLDEII